MLLVTLVAACQAKSPPPVTLPEASTAVRQDDLGQFRILRAPADGPAVQLPLREWADLAGRPAEREPMVEIDAARPWSAACRDIAGFAPAAASVTVALGPVRPSAHPSARPADRELGIAVVHLPPAEPPFRLARAGDGWSLDGRPLQGAELKLELVRKLRPALQKHVGLVLDGALAWREVVEGLDLAREAGAERVLLPPCG